jgi:hypothetical protein
MGKKQCKIMIFGNIEASSVAMVTKTFEHAVTEAKV